MFNRGVQRLWATMGRAGGTKFLHKAGLWAALWSWEWRLPPHRRPPLSWQPPLHREGSKFERKNPGLLLLGPVHDSAPSSVPDSICRNGVLPFVLREKEPHLKESTGSFTAPYHRELSGEILFAHTKNETPILSESSFWGIFPTAASFTWSFSENICSCFEKSVLTILSTCSTDKSKTNWPPLTL